MASKGWALFVVMLGLLGVVLLTGTLSGHTTAVVQVSPQGSAIIMWQKGGLTATDGATTKFSDATPQLFAPEPMSQLSEEPVFSLPPRHELAPIDDQAQALGSTLRDNTSHCPLYH